MTASSQQNEALEALALLAGGCGNAAVRTRNRAILQEFIKKKGFFNITPQSTYDALSRGVPEPKRVNQQPQNTMTGKPSAQDTRSETTKEPQGGGDLAAKVTPGGGASADGLTTKVVETMELLLEIRLARSIIQSALTETKKRTKLKVQKLNLAESKLLDSYEEHDQQLTLFEFPPITEDLRQLLDNPHA